jgi:hypothetical protein
MDENMIYVNHGGGRIVEYGGKMEGALPGEGFWPVRNGGTGATTPEAARNNLGVIGLNDNAASATKLREAVDIKLAGDIAGEFHFDGSQDVQVITTAVNRPEVNVGIEIKPNKQLEIRSAQFAEDTKYASEKAIRLALDAKLDKAEYVELYKGIFATDAALKTAYPSAEPGAYAMVNSTNTTWAWRNSTPVGWYDTLEIQGEGIKSINGMQGEAVVLDLETHLDGYKVATIDAKLAEKQESLGDDIVGALRTGITPSQNNPFCTHVEMEEKATIKSVTTLTARVDGHETRLGEIETTQRALKVSNSTMVLSRIIGGKTVLSPGQLEDGTNARVGRTFAKDTAGTLGVVSALLDTGDIEVETITISTANIPVLLGNIATRELLPSVQSQSMLVFNRNASVNDRCRIITDSVHDDATTEIYVTALGEEEDQVITWGNEILINTSDYQQPTTAAMAGMLIVGGTVPGTWGGYFDPNILKQLQSTNFSFYLPGAAAMKVQTRLLNNIARDRFRVSMSESAWPVRWKLGGVDLINNSGTTGKFQLTVNEDRIASEGYKPVGQVLQRGWNSFSANPPVFSGNFLLDIDCVEVGDMKDIRVHINASIEGYPV